MIPRLFLLCYLAMVFSGCVQQSSSQPMGANVLTAGVASEPEFVAEDYAAPDTLTADSLHQHLTEYKLATQNLLKQKDIFRQRLLQAEDSAARQLVLDGAGYFLRKTLTDTLLPYWYGTTWDFNGHTNQPRDGLIACGYFVSTPLKHAGLNVNRYRLAQQYSRKIVNLLCAPSRRFTDFSKMMTYVQSQHDDLYLVGLDNHVGFIEKKGDKVNFIHASYVYPGVACTEPAGESLVLPYSTIFILGHLTSHDGFVEKWLTNAAISIE